MTPLVLIAHLIVDILCGYALLRKLENEPLSLFTLVKAAGIGMFVDTMVLGILSYCGVGILTGFLIFSGLTLIVFVGTVVRDKHNLTWHDPLFKGRLHIGEYFLLAIIAEKLIWSMLNLAKLPVYFDDTLNHWSGRGRALLAGTNWSWDPESVYFMGKAFGHEEYPLFLSIWRATNTALLSNPNGASERADGLIMSLFVCITVLVWIHQRTDKRWLGLIGATIIISLPLQAWHMTAGYAEIFIQAYLILGFWAIMNNRYVLAGIFTAALIWSKNEGLILFMPCLLFCLGFRLLLSKEFRISEKIKKVLIYNLTWVAAISPWILFKITHGVGFTIPGNKEIGYVEGALVKMSEALFTAPSSGILWIAIFLGIVIGSRQIMRDKDLLILLTGSLFVLLMMTFVFTCTGAYVFLENQMTIHRSLLQIAPAFVILTVLALGTSEQAELPDFD